MEKMLSVIVLTYNHSKSLFRLLDSIFEQTYKNIELLITDDGTEKFDYWEIDSYIRDSKSYNIVNYTIMTNQENVGTVRNLNKGLINSNGDYINIVAGDDFYPNKFVFEKQVSFLENNNDYMLVSGKLLDCDEITEQIINTKGSNNANELKSYVYNLPKERRTKYCFLRKIFPYATQSMCFRKSFFEEFGLYDEQYVLIEDIPMMEKLVSNDIPIGIIDECVMIHRLNSGISSTKRLFKQSNINYYRDNQRIFFEYLQKEKNIFWKIIYYDYYLVSKYRIFMASNSSKKQHLLGTLLYLPVLIIYSFINYKNFLNKLNDFLRSL